MSATGVDIVTQADRKELTDVFQLMYDNKSCMDYQEVRPLPLLTLAQLKAVFAARQLVRADCSWSVNMGFYAGGFKCPMGPEAPYGSGIGNTTTLYGNLPHIASFVEPESIDFKQVHQGTLLMFDAPPENLAHVTVVMEPEGIDPLIFSFGGSGGPQIEHFSVERLYHPGQTVTLLAISGLGETPLDPWHYLWFDDIKRKLKYGSNSERLVVMNYDKFRKHPALYAAQLKIVHANLNSLILRLQSVMKSDPDNNVKERRHWRLEQLVARAGGLQVAT